MSPVNKGAVRTVLQGLAVALSGILDASGLAAALPWAGGAVTVAGALSRIMASPVVEALL